MNQLNISLSDSMNTFINEQADRQGYPSANDYICSLITEAQKKVDEERLEKMLIEGLESGESIKVTDEWWKEKRSKLIGRGC